MKRLLHSLACIGIMASPGAAPAEEPGPEAQKLAVIKFWEMATCVVKRDEWRVERLLASEPGSDERTQLQETIAEKNKGCLKAGILRMSGRIWSNALAGVYIGRKFEKGSYPDVTGVPQLYDFANLKPTASDELKRRTTVRQFVECVTRASSSEVIRLLGTQPYTPAEAAAFVALQPAMGPCLPVEKGTQVSFTKLDLRAEMGRVAYELQSARGIAGADDA